MLFPLSLVSGLLLCLPSGEHSASLVHSGPLGKHRICITSQDTFIGPAVCAQYLVLSLWHLAAFR